MGPAPSTSPETRGPLGEAVRYGWGEGLLRQVWTADGGETHLRYDGQKNLEAVRLPNGGEAVYRHDGQGTVDKLRDPRGAVTEVQWDSEGRALRVSRPLGLGQELEYDAEGNLLHARDATREVRLRYGHFHRLVEREEAGTTLRFEYDTEDRLLAVVNEADERYTFTLNAAGQAIEEQGFDGQKRVYLRDLAGRVTKTFLPSGRVTELAYDAAGRFATVRHSDGTGTAFRYDARGLLVGADNESAQVVLERDARGRVVAESQDGGQRWVRGRYAPGGARTRSRPSSTRPVAPSSTSTTAAAGWWASWDGARGYEPIGLRRATKA